jgi:hypothetical protein
MSASIVARSRTRVVSRADEPTNGETDKFKKSNQMQNLSEKSKVLILLVVLLLALCLCGDDINF